MLVAKLAKIGEGKFTIPAFGFLQAQDVRRMFAQEFCDEIDPQANRINIPCGKRETHVMASG